MRWRRLPRRIADHTNRSRPRGDRKPCIECVNELPDVYQSALRLHYWMGASVSEIAEMLDAPENTVKSYLHRARRLLQAMLAERGFNAADEAMDHLLRDAMAAEQPQLSPAFDARVCAVCGRAA